MENLLFERRKKYSGHKHSVLKNNVNKIKINFDLDTFNTLCAYVISENRNIRRGALINLRNLFEVMDFNLYNNDPEKMKRITFIRKGLEARISKRLNSTILIINYINGGIIGDNLLDIRNLTLLSNDELEWINETVDGALKYAFIYNDVDKLLPLLTKFKASEFRSRAEIVEEIESVINDMQTKFRLAKARASSEVVFNLCGDNFKESMTEIYTQLSNPNRKLYTGMQGLNEMIGGFFESGRTYLFLGNAGTGKSITLLDLAVQLKKYNKNFVAKDPTKIPTIVYLTMENSTRESVARLYSMVTGHEDMTKFDLDEVMEQIRTEGELYVNSESPISIIIKYVQDKTIDTGYLYTLCEDLEDQGYETIALFQDHIKKIRSAYPIQELRVELGEIMNQFKTFAVAKDIPLVTVSHINRDGAKSIEEGKRNNKYDLIRQIGRAQTGESLLMIDNADCAFILGKEFDQDGNTYMAFKSAKSRVKINEERTYIAQPYVDKNTSKLVEDFYAKVPVFKETLRPNVSEARLDNNGLTQKQGCYNQIKNYNDIIKDCKHEDEHNIFESSSGYSEPIIETSEPEDEYYLNQPGKMVKLFINTNEDIA